MWLGTIAGALAQVTPVLAQPVAAVASLPLGYLVWLADRSAALPFAEVAVAVPGPLAVLALYAGGGVAVLAWRRWWRRRGDAREEGRLGSGGLLDGRGPGSRGRGGWRRRAAGIAALLGVALALAVALPLVASVPAPPRDLTVSFIDVGQGDATLIQHGAAAVLVDTGPPGDRIVQRLRAAGVRRLDVLVATHDALDHDGSAREVLDRVPVELVLDGEEATPHARMGRLAAGSRVRRVASDAGQVIRAGPIELRVLWPRRVPAAAPGAEPNDRATVLHVRDGAFDLLLTADAESNVTAALDLPVAEVMKVAHHGSADPGAAALLARVRPRVAVIPVGRHNTYGHPAPATLAALRAVPDVRRTDRDGTVVVRVHDGRMSVESER
jgi:competence protein ComEC